MTRVASGSNLPGDATGGFAFSVSGGPEACYEARRAILAADGAVPAAARDDILLLLSELVTNAIRHGEVGPDRSLGVELKSWPQRVRVAVVHPGNGFRHEPVPPPTCVGSGWGLVLVDRIADRWGIDGGKGSTRVWFELRSAA
jgi:anti-sigma regulatory factor (Ser/Thr protein kinase)